jgi:type II secretory pathway pseudopilin PulG
MDHHCPWITNCVGHHNHKAFWLYCFYIGICGLIFDYKTIAYFFEQTYSEKLFEHSLLFVFWWIIECVAIAPFSLMVLGLSSLHFNFALNNMTTLESMGGYNTRMPCENEETIKRVPNKYDKGLLTNVCEFFHNDPLLFWWPTINKIAYQGQVHTKAPIIGPEEMIVHIRGNKEYNAEEKLLRPQSLAEVKVQEILDLAENFTSDKHLQFLDRMLEVGKRQDKTFGTVPQLPTFMYTPLGQEANMPPEYQAYMQQQMQAYQQKLKELHERQLKQIIEQQEQARTQAQSPPTTQIVKENEAEKPKEVTSPGSKISSNKKPAQDEFELDYPVKVVQTFVKQESKSSSSKDKEEEDGNKSTIVVEQPEKSESTEKIEKSEHSELSVEKVENTEKENEDFQIHEDKSNEKEEQQ